MTQDTFAPDKSPAHAREIISTLDEMHTILKSVLADVITDQAARRISLNARTPE